MMISCVHLTHVVCLSFSVFLNFVCFSPPSLPHSARMKEYTEELRDITGGKGGKGKGQSGVADGNITLINQRSVGDDLPVNMSWRDLFNHSHGAVLRE